MLKQAGDTIIEVLLAITIFSLVSVGVMSIMNQSTNTAQAALEITLVRQQIDAQAEALRAAHQAYTRLTTAAERNDSTWKAIVGTVPPTPSHLDTSSVCPSQGTLNSLSSSLFVMNPRNGALLDPATQIQSIVDGANPLPIYARVMYDESAPDVTSTAKSYGLWIESEVQNATTPGIPKAYNFRIRACWNGPTNSNVPMQLETTVRLYDAA